MESIISDFDHLGADDIAGVRDLYGGKYDAQQGPLTVRQNVPFYYGSKGANNDPTSYIASGLPPGFTLNAKTGEFNGTATQSGVFDPVITAVGPIANAYTSFPLTVKGFEDVPGLLAIVPWSGAYPVADPIRPRLYACPGDGIDMVDTETLKVTRLYSSHDLYPGGVSGDASKYYFTQPTDTGELIQAIDLNTLKLLPSITLDPNIHPTSSFVEGPDGRGYYGTMTGIVAFDLATGAELVSFGAEAGNVSELAISPDRKTLYASSVVAGTFSYDISTPQPTALQSGDDFYDLNPSPDGRYLYGLQRTENGSTLIRTILPQLTASRAFGALPEVGGDLAVGPDGVIYHISDLSSSSILVYDPVSLRQTAKVDLAGTGVSQPLGDSLYPTYSATTVVPDGSDSYLFSPVYYRDDFNFDNELWKFSTDLASFPPPPVPPTKNLLNVSTRAIDRNGNDSMIGGFIVQGPDPKKILVRAIGPSLPITGAMDNPVLDLYDATGKLLKSNDDWVTDRLNVLGSQIPPASPRESAILMTLAPGAYTAVVHDAREQPGLALVEIYDLDANHSLLANISTRGEVEAGDNVMIGGFIIGGTDPTQVLVRALGPSLTAQGVTGALPDPILELHDGKGNLISSNDDWRTTQQAAIAATKIAPTNDKESAILATLAPGNYTAIVRGKNAAAGVALVEVYNLDAASSTGK